MVFFLSIVPRHHGLLAKPRISTFNSHPAHLSRPSSKTARSSRSKENKPRSHFRWKRFFLKWTCIGVLIVAAVLGFYAWRASRLDISQIEHMRERSTVFDMDGKVWSRLQGENRVPVALADVSPFFIASLLAQEDTRFFHHMGVDPRGLARAVVQPHERHPQGGLKIYTTIDPELEDEAQKSLDRALTKVEQKSNYSHPKKSGYSDDDRKMELPTDYLQGAVVVVDNRTGAIRALVGGRDYRDSKFNRAIDSHRTVGSTFKPLVYAAAFAKGMSPDTPISDGPLEPGEIAHGGGWHPGNSDDKFGGMLPAEEGLIHSRNTMSIRVGNRAGFENVAQFAAKAGLPEIPLSAQSYIGNFGATPKDVTMAYAVLANGGVRRQAYVIERIDSADGEIIFRAAHGTVPVFERSVCTMTTGIMSEIMQRGTAASAKSLGWTKPAAGKTGTTDGYHDSWFVGFTSTLTCGVWVGLDKPVTIIPKGYGAALALPVWVDVMKRASAEKYPADALGPKGVARMPAPISPKPDSSTGDDGGLRKPDKENGGVLRSFKKFFGGK